MHRDDSDEQLSKMHSPILESREPVSNVSLESSVHDTKHFPPSVSTEDGMEIYESDEH
jgi:hypothetical protein